ncbi:malonate decarboxylase holo-ACP synthase [Bacillus seohaeanensis]|jgi:phosphoribosyl-dephospho-CoA transferase|uniref:Malonate decarboxylase holo-ACP synthase n=1 Tax=Bacillus seohaeanensis TaxID=284580 RepID=A0ABW5RUS4_9BACI
MELKPHDLLEINSVSDLISYTPLPEWGEGSIEKSPFVVVRRARASEGLVAVGVRGSKRNERFAAFLPVDRIVRRITPEQLVRESKWDEHSKEIFRCLEQTSNIMNVHSLIWGPTGSVGFELTSGTETVTAESDIDLIIRTPHRLEKKLAQHLLDEFQKVGVRIDVQMETPAGAVNLLEYARVKEDPVLVKTQGGPLLMEDPWILYKSDN